MKRSFKEMMTESAGKSENGEEGLAACVVDPELNNSKRPKRACNSVITKEVEEMKEALA